MVSQRFDPASPQSASPDADGDRLGQQQDALRKVAFHFQNIARVARFVPLVTNVPSAELSSLCDSVRAYAALERARHAAPERVLVTVKAATNAVSSSLAPTVVDSVARLVLQAFLAGYYGDVVRGRSEVAAARRR